MLEKTLSYLTEIDLPEIISKTQEYCSTTGHDLPRNIQLRFELARRLLDTKGQSPEFEKLSANELREIKKTLERTVELYEYADRLKAFRKLIQECGDHIPDAQLGLTAKDLLMRFSPDLLLGSSISPYALDARCENFANDYQEAYISFHNQWHYARRKNAARVDRIIEMAGALDSLDNLLQTETPQKTSWSQKVSSLQNLPTCEDISPSKLGYAPFCPNCVLRYGLVFDWNRLPDLEEEIKNCLEYRQNQISKKLADELVKRSSEDPLSGIVEAISVSNLSKLPSILTDDVVKALEKVLHK